MLTDEPHRLFPQSRGGFQPPQDIVGDLRAFLGVAVKMSPAAFVPGKGSDFAGVVEQRRPAQRQIGADARRHVGGVGEQIIGVVGTVLVKADHGLQFRDHSPQNRGEAAQILRADQWQQFT